jgi:hypothetical protein
MGWRAYVDVGRAFFDNNVNETSIFLLLFLSKLNQVAYMLCTLL